MTVMWFAGGAAILVGSVVGLRYLWRVFSVINGIWASSRRDRKRRTDLLYRVDHRALFSACMELSERVAGGDLKPRMYYPSDPVHGAEVSRFPQAIRDLEPDYVMIDIGGVVMVALTGGIDRFGVTAYPEDYGGPPVSGSYGHKKLLDGLWYYDAGYDRDPQYEKKIEALRPKDKRGQEAWESQRVAKAWSFPGRSAVNPMGVNVWQGSTANTKGNLPG